MGHKELIIRDTESGDLFRPPDRKKKRTEGFFMTTQADAICLAKMKLTGMEQSILLYLLGVMDYNNIAVVTQSFIASELDTTEATISSCIGKLVEKNLVRRVLISGTKAFEINQVIATRGAVK